MVSRWRFAVPRIKFSLRFCFFLRKPIPLYSLVSFEPGFLAASVLPDFIIECFDEFGERYFILQIVGDIFVFEAEFFHTFVGKVSTSGHVKIFDFFDHARVEAR